MSRVNVKFASRKINKIRWQPRSSTIFITGSCDDEENTICVWKFPKPMYNDDIENENDDNGDDDDPQVMCSTSFPGSVTDLKVISDDLLFASSSLGSIFMFQYSDEKLQHLHTWLNVHSFSTGPASATGISVKGEDIASVGEDGNLGLFNFNVKQKVRTIESSDLCSFNCVTYLRYQEVIAGNSLGYLRLWDIRSSSDASSSLLALSREQRGVSSINVHPTQSHILATGYEDGSLCIWDMRQDKKPVSLLNGHSAAVSELLFHPTNPDFLYTSSLDGTVWQWDSSNLRSNLSVFPTSLDQREQNNAKGNPWFICDASKHKLEITSLYCQPWTCVNSIDLSGSTLIWGTDNEELCILNNIAV